LTKALAPKNRDLVLDSSGRVESGIAASLNRRDIVETSLETNRENMDKPQETTVASEYSFLNNDSDDDLPTIEELVRMSLPAAPATTKPSSKPALQHPQKSSLHDEARMSFGGKEGEYRGSRDSSIVIEGGQSRRTNIEVEYTAKVASLHNDENSEEQNSSLHDTLPTQDLAAELSQPVDLSTHDRWYDVEAGCYIGDKAPPLNPEEQEGSPARIRASSHSPGSSHGPSQRQSGQHNDSGIAHSASEELAIHSHEDRILDITADDKPICASPGASATSEPVIPTTPLPTAQVIDTNQDWEICKVIDRVDVDGVPHYLVVWSETLLPITSLGNAMDLVDEFEDKRGVKRRGSPGSKRVKRFVAEPEQRDGQKPKRARAGYGKEPKTRCQGLSKTVLEMNKDGRSWDEICATLRR
jgi:hypothetical protein